MSKAPAVDYAIKIIECLAKEGRPLGIADITNTLGINKNAVSRILCSLTENNWVICIDDERKKYSLTMRPFSMTSKGVQSSTLFKTCELMLSRLHEELPDSLYMGVKHGDKVVYQIHYDSTRDVKISGRVGGEYPLHCSAPGKILLAWSEKCEIERYFDENGLALQKSKFFDEIELIKFQGYATDNEEFSKGIICYASPIMNASGEVIATIGVSSLTLYDSLETLIFGRGKAISDCAKQISYMLGYEEKTHE